METTKKVKPISQSPDEEKEKAQRNRIDIYTTILLGMAALAVAWCSYQSNLWNGIQTFKLMESNSYFRRAQQDALMLAQQQEIDAAVGINFLIAVIDNKRQLIDYYLGRGKSELVPIMKSWWELDPMHNKQAPPHPLEMPAYKLMVNKMLAKSDSATARGDLLWNDAQNANKAGDRYTLLTVVFNLVMFFSAIAPKMTHLKGASLLVIIAGVIFLMAFLLVVLSMPLAH